MMKRWMPLFVSLAFAATVFGQEARHMVAGDYAITGYGDGAERTALIVDYQGKPGPVSIPEVINQYAVKSIGNNAFRAKGLTEISGIPPNSSIGESAFAENKLTGLVIPGHVQDVGVGAFSDNRLTRLVLEEGVRSIEEGAFRGNQLTELRLPATVERVEDGAFVGNPLTRITIGGDVTVEGRAFGNGFAAYYLQTGKQPGTYVYQDSQWWTEQEAKGKYDWAKAFFFDLNSGYQYEWLNLRQNQESDFPIISHNQLLEIGAGYDFGRITARVYGDFGFLAGGTVLWNDVGLKPISDGLDSSMGKFGLEAGIKLVKTPFFDFVIPLGALFNWTTYTHKKPGYSQNNHPYDRKWEYSYTSLVTGISAQIKLGKHFVLCIPFTIGYPIVRNFEYKEVLRGDYIWTDTGSATLTDKDYEDVDVFAYSVGAGIRFHF